MNAEHYLSKKPIQGKQKIKTEGEAARAKPRNSDACFPGGSEGSFPENLLPVVGFQKRERGVSLHLLQSAKTKCRALQEEGPLGRGESYALLLSLWHENSR